MIKRFYVEDLFGVLRNEIHFRENGITVIVGPNGCGKTTMLQMLEAIFSKNHGLLCQYEFAFIEMEISGHVLRIEPFNECTGEDNISVRSLKYIIDSQELTKCYTEDSKINSSLFWTRAIPTLRRRPGNLFMDIRTGATLTLPEVVNEYFEQLPEEIKSDIIAIPTEVYELINGLQVELITTDRLKKITHDDEYRRMEVVQKYVVEECSEELRSNLKNILSEYANISQKLDEKFPFKILETIKQHNQFSETELKENILIIDELRKKHVRAGVLEESNDRILNVEVNPEGIDDSTAAVLTIYYQDMRTKLEALNDISDRIILFKDMINSKFRINKEIFIDKEVGIKIVQSSRKEEVNLRSLSSGEQQEIVLLYNLVFKGKKEKLILLDEPEISLNVNWQREFLDDMKKIVQMNGFTILLATHSPQIINDNWDMVETLGDIG